MELPSSLTTKRVRPAVEPVGGLHHVPCRGPLPALALAAGQVVSWPVEVLMLKMRRRSALRSGTMRYFSVGSVNVACG